MIDFCFQENLIFIFLLWCPYFFIHHDFSYFNTTLIAMTFPVATALGSLVINPLLSDQRDHTGRRTIGLVIMEYLCFLSCLFIEVDEKNLLYFIVFFGLGFIFYMVPYSKSTTTEVSERLQNGKEQYLMINFMRIMRGILTTFSLFGAGFIMNIGNIYNLYRCEIFFQHISGQCDLNIVLPWDEKGHWVYQRETEGTTPIEFSDRNGGFRG